MDETTARKRLREEIRRAGGQRAFAKKHGFSAPYINDVLHGRRDMADKICAAIGLQRIVIYNVAFELARPLPHQGE